MSQPTKHRTMENMTWQKMVFFWMIMRSITQSVNTNIDIQTDRKTKTNTNNVTLQCLGKWPRTLVTHIRQHVCVCVSSPRSYLAKLNKPNSSKWMFAWLLYSAAISNYATQYRSCFGYLLFVSSLSLLCFHEDNSTYLHINGHYVHKRSLPGWWWSTLKSLCFSQQRTTSLFTLDWILVGETFKVTSSVHLSLLILIFYLTWFRYLLGITQFVCQPNGHFFFKFQTLSQNKDDFQLSLLVATRCHHATSV